MNLRILTFELESQQRRPRRRRVVTKAGANSKQVLFSLTRRNTYTPLETQPAKTADIEKIPAEQEKKPKLFNKPTGQTQAAKKVDIDVEYFPSLGEDGPKRPVKKPEPIVEQPSATANANTGGPRKFLNAKKQGQGESFAPLDPNIVEKAIPPPVQVPEKTAEEPAQRTTTYTEPAQRTTTYNEPAPVADRKPGESGFVRRTAAPETPQEVPVDSKFKFGGEGPKKFVANNKISFKREEEKSEQEILV